MGQDEQTHQEVDSPREQSGPNAPAPDGQARLPRVSIITTVLNGETYLAEAIESVLEQRTDIAWEMLLVDDGSCDGSEAIAREYARQYPGKIRVLQHAGGVNRGISASRNLGLKHARGELLALLDADDVWLPNLLATQVSLVDQRPEVAMVYASAERWIDFDLPFDPVSGSQGRNYVPALIPASEAPGIIRAPKLLEWFSNDESMTPCTCTVLVRTAIARALGGFVNSLRGLYDDQAFYAKLALEETVYVRLECLARYRQHARSCCALARENRSVEQRERSRFACWLEGYREEIGVINTIRQS